MKLGYVQSDERDVESHYETLRSFAPGVYGVSLDSADIIESLRGTGKGKLSIPWSVKRTLDPTHGEEFQTTGDCTSHGCRNAADTSRAWDVVVKGESESWEARGATEPIYGARLHGNEGMAPITAGKWLFDNGMLLRRKYPFADLTTYTGSTGSSWGREWQRGIPRDLIAEARKSPFRFLARVNSLEDARDLLHNGYGLFGGFFTWLRAKRDKNGVSATEGSTAHCIEIGGCDDTGREPLWVANNCHWLKWVTGPSPEWAGDLLPEKALPVGVTMARSDFLMDPIRRGDLWAIGGAEGFPPRTLPDFGSGEFL
jgi:hypothetical protein